MGKPLNNNTLKVFILPYGLALIIGSLLPLAFAPYSFWPLAMILPAALLWLLRNETAWRRVFTLSFTFGLGYFGFGVYWIYNSLHDFGQAPPLIAGFITALLIAVLAVFPALCLSFWRHLCVAVNQRFYWSLPVLWFAFEWLRGWVITGLPWLSLGYSQTDSPLAGFAPWIGVYGLSAVCILIAMALYLLAFQRRYPLAAVVIGVPLLGLASMQIDWTLSTSQSVKVTMVQGNIPQHLKWRYDQLSNIFNTYWRETNMHWDSDLIIWPETALPGQSQSMEQEMLQPMHQVAKREQTAIMTGLVVSEDPVSEGAEPNFYNSVMMLGEARSVYHKRHLVMFGEYYPLRSLLDFVRQWILIPYSDLTAGPDEQPLMRLGDLVFGVSICFEDVFSREVMRALPEANILVNVSNDAWFGNSSAPHQHLQIAQMRSLETERAMLRSTNTGVSAFIDHKGNIKQHSEQFKTQSITSNVKGRQGLTPFYYFSKVQGGIAVSLLLGFLLFAYRSHKTVARKR